MKADVARTIDTRVAAAFDDLLGGIGGNMRREILGRARDLVEAVWMNKIYAALPKDKTAVSEYFLDRELEVFLDDAVEECYARIDVLAEHARRTPP